MSKSVMHVAVLSDDSKVIVSNVKALTKKDINSLHIIHISNDFKTINNYTVQADGNDYDSCDDNNVLPFSLKDVLDNSNTMTATDVSVFPHFVLTLPKQDRKINTQDVDTSDINFNLDNHIVIVKRREEVDNIEEYSDFIIDEKRSMYILQHTIFDSTGEAGLVSVDHVNKYVDPRYTYMIKIYPNLRNFLAKK